MEELSLDQILTTALIYSTRLELSLLFISRLSDKALFNAFVELQPTVVDNPHTREKCRAIILLVDDEWVLKKMIVITKSFHLISEAMGKITTYGVLSAIAKSRPDLEVHVRGRISFIPVSTRFILDD